MQNLNNTERTTQPSQRYGLLSQVIQIVIHKTIEKHLSPHAVPNLKHARDLFRIAG